MEEKHRKIIKDKFEMLVEVTINIDALLTSLFKKKIINKYMLEHILSYPDSKGKVRAFYNLIQGRGPSAYKELTNSLRETCNNQAEDILIADKRFTTYPPSYIEEEGGNCPSSEEADLTQPTPFNTEDAPSINVKCHPEGKFMDINMDHLPNGVYHMRSKPRGYAIIINIYKSVGNIDRWGSEVDVAKLDCLFKGLGYEVEIYEDLSSKDLENKIKEFSSDGRLAKVDSTVVFIMSHGEQYRENARSVNLLASDGYPVNTEWIIEQFLSDSSPLISQSSSRKPKMFFFQACRGKKQDTGWTVNNNLHVDSVKINLPPSTRKYEDVIIIYSTVPGYFSKRDPDKGGWFVDKFCKIVSENAWRYDLDTMMGQVDEEIRGLKSKEYGYQTVEVVKQGLSKKIFFNPGLYNGENFTTT